MITTFTEEVYTKALNTHTTAITDGDFPSSGSFVDVSDYERFVITVAAGSLNSALTVKVQQATAANGTPKDVTGATVVVGATDDGEVFQIEVETRKLDIDNDYHFITVDVAGAAGSDDYLAILFHGVNAGEMPVTQPDNTPVIVAG